MPTGWPNNMQGRDATHTGTLMFTRSTDMNGVALPHSGYGGIAYVNVWGRSDFASRYSPAWNQDYTAASAAEVGSHEGGHNLGLSHDGNSATTYQGNLASDNTQTPITFGPIMGTAYGAVRTSTLTTLSDLLDSTVLARVHVCIQRSTRLRRVSCHSFRMCQLGARVTILTRTSFKTTWPSLKESWDTPRTTTLPRRL